MAKSRRGILSKAEESVLLNTMVLSFQIEDLESIFRRLIDKHAAPMGLYVGECSLLQICRPYGAVCC
ncbi:hypothetical protein HNP72_003372 [Sphingobacterium soli]|nr:hypothetical protein [Sphingobacterium soli]